ncbi:MAG: Holliday junction branch migration protein RuvA [Actinomycetota bacterium]
MIGSLRGRVIDREHAVEGTSAEMTIEVGGVGYRLMGTAVTVSRLPTDEDLLLYVHHHIWDAGQRLYGFLTKDERTAFEALLSAHGVGPAVALAVLATHPVDELARILAEEDLAALCEVPGVGKKTAQRLLVELQSALVLPVLEPVGAPSNGARGDGIGAGPGQGGLVDVREALVNLGYSSDEIRRAVAGLAGQDLEDADTGRLLKQALLNLANG